MNIKIKGKNVDVLSGECRYRACLRVGYARHVSAAGLSGCSSWHSDRLSCTRWDEQGCPPAGQVRQVRLEEYHHCREPRFARLVSKPSGGNARCACGELLPRWMVFEWQQRGLARLGTASRLKAVLLVWWFFLIQAPGIFGNGRVDRLGPFESAAVCETARVTLGPWVKTTPCFQAPV